MAALRVAFDAATSFSNVLSAGPHERGHILYYQSMGSDSIDFVLTLWYCFGSVKSQYPFGLSLSKPTPFDKLSERTSYFTGSEQ